MLFLASRVKWLPEKKRATRDGTATEKFTGFGQASIYFFDKIGIFAAGENLAGLKTFGLKQELLAFDYSLTERLTILPWHKCFPC